MKRQLRPTIDGLEANVASTLSLAWWPIARGSEENAELREQHRRCKKHGRGHQLTTNHHQPSGTITPGA